MKRKLIIFFITILLPIYLFSYEYYSIKSLSMANSDLILNGESDAIFYNPASLSYIKKYSFSFNVNHLYPELINNSIYLYNFSTSYNFKNYGVYAIGFYNFISDNYFEKEFLLGYAYNSLSYVKVGITFKYDTYEIKENSVTYGNGKSFNFSPGFIYHNKYLFLSFVIKNIKNFSFNEAIPDLEIFYSYSGFDFIGGVSYNNIIINYKFGIKKILNKNIIFRAGINRNLITSGFTLKYKDINFDYSIEYNLNITDILAMQKCGIRVNL